jgi:hypothetical protein
MHRELNAWAVEVDDTGIGGESTSQVVASSSSVSNSSGSATQLRSPRLCLQVHDELIFECPSNEEDLARMMVCDL